MAVQFTALIVFITPCILFIKNALYCYSQAKVMPIVVPKFHPQFTMSFGSHEIVRSSASCGLSPETMGKEMRRW